MKFTKKLGLTMIAICLVAVCSGFADAKTNKKFLEALNNGDEITVEKMLKKDRGLANIEDDIGRKPLMIASMGNNKKIAEVLINNGADVNARDKNGWTPLIHASCKGNTQIAELLLANGADINARDKNGWTSLMHASRNGKAGIINLLLKNGVDVTIKNNDGKTAFVIASQYRYKYIEELLFPSLSKEEKAAIEKEQQEAEELARKETEERERREREAKMRYKTEVFYYGITDDGRGIRITGVKDSKNKNIIIPATIEGFPVTEVLLKHSAGKLILTGFEREENIKYIEFEGEVACDLYLPNCHYFDFCWCYFENPTFTVRKEWNGASHNFNGLKNVSKIIIEEGVTGLDGSLGYAGFAKCKELTTVVIPSTFKTMCDSCFEECKKLEEIIIPKNLKEIYFVGSGFLDSEAFLRCPKLPIAMQARLRQLGYKGGF